MTGRLPFQLLLHRSVGGRCSFPWIAPLCLLIRTLYCLVLSKEVSSTIFKVFGMTRPGIEPRSPGSLAKSLSTRLFFFRRMKILILSRRFVTRGDYQSLSVLETSVFLAYRNHNTFLNYQARRSMTVTVPLGQFRIEKASRFRLLCWERDFTQSLIWAARRSEIRRVWSGAGWL